MTKPPHVTPLYKDKKTNQRCEGAGVEDEAEDKAFEDEAHKAVAWEGADRTTDTQMIFYITTTD